LSEASFPLLAKSHPGSRQLAIKSYPAASRVGKLMENMFRVFYKSIPMSSQKIQNSGSRGAGDEQDASRYLQLEISRADNPGCGDTLFAVDCNDLSYNGRAFAEILPQIAICGVLNALNIERTAGFFHWYDGRKDILEDLPPKIIEILEMYRPGAAAAPTHENQVEMGGTLAEFLKSLLLNLGYTHTAMPDTRLAEATLNLLQKLPDNLSPL
jgi:hypothetical protein